MQSYLTHVHSVGIYCVQYRKIKKLNSNINFGDFLQNISCLQIMNILQQTHCSILLHNCKYLTHIKIKQFTFNNGREIIKVERQAYTTLAFMAFCWQMRVKNASCACKN